MPWNGFAIEHLEDSRANALGRRTGWGTVRRDWKKKIGFKVSDEIDETTNTEGHSLPTRMVGGGEDDEQTYRIHDENDGDRNLIHELSLRHPPVFRLAQKMRRDARQTYKRNNNQGSNHMQDKLVQKGQVHLAIVK